MTFGPVVNARYFTEDIPILAAPPSASRSMSTATTRTRDPELDMELEASFIAKPTEDNLFQRIRASRSEISSAKLKMYHELCNKRLENTMHMFRVREERERVAVSRGNKKQRVGSDAGTALSPSTNFEARDRQWKLIRESNDVRVYRHMRRKQHTSTMMASGTIHGSLNDVMNGLYADTTKDSQVLHTLLSNKFLDAGVLHVDRCGDDQEQFQFSGITWTALKTPGLFFCKNRDFLSFKKMDCFKDDYGDEFGYLVLHSIEPTDECSKAISSKASRYVRGFISIGILFKKQADDLVSMYMHGEFNPKGRISSSFGDTCFANSIIALANTAQSGQAKNLSMLLHSFSAAPGAMATHLFSKPGKEKDLCGVCARSMFFWDSPQQCRGCWQRVCRSCRVKKPIFCDHYHRAHQGKKSQAPCMESFCLQCVASVIPSGVQTKAKLLKQLEKKRKRSSVSGHRQTISSSITESAVRPAYQASIGVPDDNSSISAMSFQESEKHQQHRLSLTRGPAGRRTPRPRLSSMVDVVEHFEIQNNNFKPYNNNNVSAGASSSIPSLISFSSNDAGTISDYGVALTASSNNRDGADFRVGSRQYHVDILAAGLKRDQPTRTGGSNVANLRAARPPRTEEYYQKVLQRYLRSNKSFISMNSNISSALTNGSSNHNALTDREDVSTVRSVVDSVSSGSAASVVTADLYFKHL